MSAVPFFTDEGVYSGAALALRRLGLDAVSTPEAGRRGASDESQLIWATGKGRVLVTFNVGEFAKLHAAWITNARHHAGLIVSKQRPIGDLIHRLVHLAQTLSAEQLRDRIEFLSDW